MKRIDKAITRVALKAVALPERAAEAYKSLANSISTRIVTLCGDVWGAEGYAASYEMVESATELLHKHGSVDNAPKAVRSMLNNGTFYRSNRLTGVGRLSECCLEWMLRNADKPTTVKIPEIRAKLECLAELLSKYVKEASVADSAEKDESWGVV